MQLTLEVESPNELQVILQYLRLFPTVKILAAPKMQPATFEIFPEEKPKSDFLQFYGILNTGLNHDEIDEKIKKTREEEWERDTL